MVNKIYRLDSTKINDTTYIVRLIKRYHITLLDIFPKVLDLLIREYVDDVIEINITKKPNEYNIIVTNQYINCMMMSFSFTIKYTFFDRIIIICNNISNNIINNNHNTDCYSHMWQKISNMYLKQCYNINGIYDTFWSFEAVYNNNVFKYGEIHIFKICNHRLFKNIIIIMQTIFKKLKS